MSSLNARAWISLVVLEVILAIVLFVCAGTTRYWQGWVYLLLFFVMAAGITVDLMRRDPALLERRMKGGPVAEPRPLQRFLMLGASVGFFGLIVIPALDFRYKWSIVPLAAVVTGDVLFVVGFLLIARVYRENTFTSATIGITEGQRVISSGPYAIVRHPMYASARLSCRHPPRARVVLGVAGARVHAPISGVETRRRRASPRSRTARLRGLPSAGSLPARAICLVAQQVEFESLPPSQT